MRHVKLATALAFAALLAPVAWANGHAGAPGHGALGEFSHIVNHLNLVGGGIQTMIQGLWSFDMTLVQLGWLSLEAQCGHAAATPLAGVLFGSAPVSLLTFLVIVVGAPLAMVYGAWRFRAALARTAGSAWSLVSKRRRIAYG